MDFYSFSNGLSRAGNYYEFIFLSIQFVNSVGIIFFLTVIVYAFCITLSAFLVLFEVVILISLTGRCWACRNSPY